jgi:hypothetical protein
MKNTQKHTQGPWRPYFYGKDDFGRIIADVATNDGNNRICEVSPIDLREDEVNANARLIAAAPDLLDALIAMMNRYGDKTKHPFCNASIAARAAIAKAEGVQ